MRHVMSPDRDVSVLHRRFQASRSHHMRKTGEATRRKHRATRLRQNSQLVASAIDRASSQLATIAAFSLVLRVDFVNDPRHCPCTTRARRPRARFRPPHFPMRARSTTQSAIKALQDTTWRRSTAGSA
jgi:hypothetical protein